ncbi:hypothetical protein C6P40_005023 [Pichia californica]|uniref:Uncharacterized protein n=1 Tax=Pichia californica TaxID=460514 RepID=A0A9P6WPV4_9ASCO|nr:hypothetical protein C6P42_004010 [[Candida] californica]KAG0691104.1 hypothetical protein C6P40_005023 [[Candida] californica]
MPVDLAREEHGTWIGVGKNGRICTLVNYRESKNPCQMGGISRGAITKDFLESDLDPITWAEAIKVKSNNFNDIGGFSLLFGILNKEKCNDSMYIISNRVDGVLRPFEDLTQNEKYKILGLSNSSIFQPWPKVIRGKELVKKMLETRNDGDGDDGDDGDDGNEYDNVTTTSLLSRNNMIDEMMNIMSDQYKGIEYGDSMKDTIINIVPQTVFVPALHNDLLSELERKQGKYYGTRTQTVILLSKDGHLSYVERNISPESDSRIKGKEGESIQRFDLYLP